MKSFNSLDTLLKYLREVNQTKNILELRQGKIYGRLARPLHTLKVNSVLIAYTVNGKINVIMNWLI